MKNIQSYFHKEDFILESGEIIKNLRIDFHTYGILDSKKSNVIWVCHALTANSDVFDWWNGVVGENCLFNTCEHFIVCANIIGSCYGTTGPLDIENDGQKFENFPLITTRDLAKAHQHLKEHLGIEKINTLVGASLGGQQALEWSILSPESIENLILIATNARHSAFGIAFNESQRLAILADSTYGNKCEEAGRSGLIAARSIAMLSYRSYSGYDKTQTNPGNHIVSEFQAATYQRYQGQKLANRFNAYSYVSLTKTMDSHNVGRKRPSVELALQSVKARTLVIGIETDLLFPVTEQQFISEWIPDSRFQKIQSDFGHDGFLVESIQLTGIIKEFLTIETKEKGLKYAEAEL